MGKPLTFDEMFEKKLYQKVRKAEVRSGWFPLLFGGVVVVLVWLILERARFPEPKGDGTMFMVALGVGVGATILSAVFDFFGERKARRELIAFASANAEAVRMVCAKDPYFIENLERHGVELRRLA